MEYCSFFHSAAYTLKHPAVSQDLQVKNGKIPEATPPVQNAQEVTTSAINSLPSPPQMPLPSAPVLPPPPLYPPPSLPPTPPVPAHPLSLPVIQTEPPSPHLSWGACSDGDVYSRIGAFRPSRLSSLSNHSKVILFEHSSLWPLKKNVTSPYVLMIEIIKSAISCDFWVLNYLKLEIYETKMIFSIWQKLECGSRCPLSMPCSTGKGSLLMLL